MTGPRIEPAADGGRPLTGRKVLAIAVAAFGVIITVNLVLAWQAVKTFPGLEVKNSYVASQTFDADRAAQVALGWTLDAGYSDGALVLAFRGADGAPVDIGRLEVLVGRTTEARDDVTPEFRQNASTFTAPLDLAPGKWLVRVRATAADGTLFQQRRDLFVKG
jgi:nitrogen fixation protein FixH